MFRNLVLQVDKWLGIAEMLICVALLGLIVAVTGGGVIMRYVFNAPLTWGSDLGLLAMVWLAFVGAGTVFRRGGHLSASNLPAHLPEPAKRALEFVISAIIVGCACVMGWYGVRMAQAQASQEIVSLGVPRSLYSWPIVWAAISLAVASAQRVIPVEQPSSSHEPSTSAGEV